MNKLGNRFKAEMTLLGVVIIWGYTFPVIKNVLNAIPPFTFLTYRFFLAFLSIFLIFRHKLKKFNLQTIYKGFLLGLFLFIGYFGQTVGTQFTTATKTAFITGISVVLVPVFSFFWIREKLRFNSLVGVLLATLGLFLMNANGELFLINKGDALVFLCAVGFALYIVAVHVYTKEYDYVQLVFIQLVTVFLLFFLMSILLEREALHFSYHLSVFWAIVITGVFATAFALYLQNRFQQYSSPTKIAIIFSTEPVFGALFSHLILGETTGVHGVIGGIAIFIGMLIAQLEKEEKGEAADLHI
ncbi:MAG TPA: DMT family transporter [Atribacterota bacterium]|nr:DMT family transporter [Atribacterota bacterium]